MNLAKLYFCKKQKKLNIKGLYAAGQSMGGLFGSNRLGSTSLAPSGFGYRTGKNASEYAKKLKKILMKVTLKATTLDFLTVQ